MAKVTIALTAVSTLLVLIAFGKGMSILRGGDVGSHLYWSMAALIAVLAANFVAMVHAAQSDRIIRELRRMVDAQTPGLGERPPAA
jgi:hypothetical protein